MWFSLLWRLVRVRFGGQVRANGVGFFSLPMVIKSLYLVYLITVIMTEIIGTNGTLTPCWAMLSIFKVIISFHPPICSMGGYGHYPPAYPGERVSGRFTQLLSGRN